MTTFAQHTGLVSCQLVGGKMQFKLAQCSAKVVHSHADQLVSIYFRGLVDLQAIEVLRQATALAVNRTASQVLYLDRSVTLLSQSPTFSEACMAHGQRPAAIVLAESDLSVWANYAHWAGEQRLKRAVFSPQQKRWAAEWALDHHQS